MTLKHKDKSNSRYIPQEVKDVVEIRQQGQCAFPKCRKPPEIFHHTRRWALNKSHDPDYIVHLCKSHERLAHSGLIKHEEENPAKWKIDCKVMEFYRDQTNSKPAPSFWPPN